MSTDGQSIRRRGPRKRVAEPLFVTKTEIAQHLGLGDLATIDSWIAEGSFPPPHSRPGARYAVWLRRHWQAYVDDREWPAAAWQR